jgi:hypothetical protein
MSTSTHPSLLTFDNVNDGTIKIKKLKLTELNKLCCHFYDLIKDLEVKVEKSKAPPPLSPMRPTSSRLSSRS